MVSREEKTEIIKGIRTLIPRWMTTNTHIYIYTYICIILLVNYRPVAFYEY